MEPVLQFKCPECDKVYKVSDLIKYCPQCGAMVEAFSGQGPVKAEYKTPPPKRVLLVEDSNIARRKIATILKSLQCEVYEAVDGLEGITQARNLEPDLIVLDVQMPVVNGLEMLGMLREDPKISHISVVMLTGQADAQTVVQASRLKADDYIRKDAPVEEIKERLSKHVLGG